MSPALIDERDLVEAAGRATIYSFLATGLGWPTVEKIDVLESILLPATESLSLAGGLRTALEERTSFNSRPFWPISPVSIGPTGCGLEAQIGSVSITSQLSWNSWRWLLAKRSSLFK